MPNWQLGLFQPLIRMTFELAQKYGCDLATHTIEVPINSTGVCKLQNDEILRNKQIVGVMFKDNPNSDLKTMEGRDLATPGMLNNAYFKLMHNNDQVLSYHPVSDLVRNAVESHIRQFDMPGFNPTNSEIVIANKALATNNTHSFVITFLYIR